MADSLALHIAVLALAGEYFPELEPTAGYSEPLIAARTVLEMVYTSAIERGRPEVADPAYAAISQIELALRTL